MMTLAAALLHARFTSDASGESLFGAHGGANLEGFRTAEVAMHASSAEQPANRPSFWIP